MKKLLSLIFVVLIVLSAFSGCFAVSAENENLTLNLADNASTNPSIKYADYISKVSFENATEDFTLVNNPENSWEFSVDSDSLYALKIDYTVLENNDEPLELSVLIDGYSPFEEAESIELDNRYYDFGGIRKDNEGNEVTPIQKVKTGDFSKTLMDPDNVKEMLFGLSAGSHNLKFDLPSGKFAVNSVSFTVPTKLPSYKEYYGIYKTKKRYNSKQIVLEAENTLCKNSDSLISLSDNSSSNVNPSSPYIDKINYIGGSNWNMPGDTISWEIDVPKDGLYTLGLNYRQKYKLNSTHYRYLKIDDVCPFEEAKNIEFPYARNWKFTVLGNGDNPYLFYLTKGKHTVSLGVTLGKLSGVCNSLENITYYLAELYREIVMITGDTPDANRDYDLFEQVNDMEKRLKGMSKGLTSIANKLTKITNGEASSNVTTINSLIETIDKMLEHKYSAHKYVSNYYNDYASVSSMALELSSMPLDIDRIYIGNANGEYEDTKSNVFSNVAFSVKRFFASFTDDYNKISNKDKSITIWVNWGRDQTKVLKYLIQSDFSVKSGIDVDIKVTNASLVHAALSGNGPDVQLHLSRSEPVNLAMRTALYDLSKFDDYEQITKRFAKGAVKPYEFGGGVYALPDTQTFYMMFIRNDIFEDMGLSVPKTWDEFLSVSNILVRNNMYVGMPYTQIIDMNQANVGVGALSIFPTLLMQKGATIYNDKHTKTTLLTSESISAFEFWTDLYYKYSYPKTYDFFNRFRIGLMPMAIQSYITYATLTAAAPEISDYWSMYTVPGFKNEDGTVSDMVTGGGTGCSILADSKNKNEAWEFLKWWTSTDVQYAYGSETEKILGSSARLATSNVEALKKFDWEKDDLQMILKQWNKVEEIPEVPGSYYVSRVIDQAFWNVVNSGENTKDMLIKWSDIADTEITRRREQYGIK